MTKSAPTTSAALSRSQAFHEASLRSEVRRAYAVIAVSIMVVLLVVAPATSHDISNRLVVVVVVGLLILITIQLGILLLAPIARQHNRGIPMWYVLPTLIIESVIPSGMMLWHVRFESIAPYAALSSPPVLAYGLLIGLTAMRLRPWMCILSGFLGAASYGGILLHVTYGMGLTQPTTGLLYLAYVNIMMMILITGLGLAWVSKEIRGHLEAALSEAETKHQMARIEHDLSIARSIQRALLPRAAPAIAGFDIAGWNRSADQTGGDYYDWQILPDGNWIVTLADVSGHGVGPAMVTAACRAYVRASSHYHTELSTLTSRINSLLAQDLPEGRFVTMVSVLIDAKSGELGLLSAGHGPIVLYVGKTGEVEDIMAQDVPLAIVPDTAYGPAQAMKLAPGDVLALVTDGFVEWSRHDTSGNSEQFGLERLRASLRRHAKLPAAEIIAAVAADVGVFAGAEAQQDDLTMVILKREG